MNNLLGNKIGYIYIMEQDNKKEIVKCYCSLCSEYGKEYTIKYMKKIIKENDINKSCCKRNKKMR